MWRQPEELYNPESLVPTVKVSGDSVILWGAISWHGFGALIPLEGKVNAHRYLMVPSDYLHPMLQHLFCAGRGVFHDDNSSIHKAQMATQ